MTIGSGDMPLSLECSKQSLCSLLVPWGPYYYLNGKSKERKIMRCQICADELKQSFPCSAGRSPHGHTQGRRCVEISFRTRCNLPAITGKNLHHIHSDLDCTVQSGYPGKPQLLNIYIFFVSKCMKSMIYG